MAHERRKRCHPFVRSRLVPREAYVVSRWMSARFTSHERQVTYSHNRRESCHIVHNDTFDFFYPTQASIIPIEASGLVNDGRG